MGLVHDGALGAQPLQRQLGVAVDEALDVGVDGLDLLALLDESFLAVRRAHGQPRPVRLGVGPVERDQTPLCGVCRVVPTRRIAWLNRGRASQIPGRLPGGRRARLAMVHAAADGNLRRGRDQPRRQECEEREEGTHATLHDDENGVVYR